MPPPSAAASVVLPFANSMFLSAIDSVLLEIVVVEPLTVRLPEIVRFCEIVPPVRGRYVDAAEDDDRYALLAAAGVRYVEAAEDCVRYVLDAVACVKYVDAAVALVRYAPGPPMATTVALPPVPTPILSTPSTSE